MSVETPEDYDLEHAELLDSIETSAYRVRREVRLLAEVPEEGVEQWEVLHTREGGDPLSIVRSIRYLCGGCSKLLAPDAIAGLDGERRPRCSDCLGQRERGWLEWFVGLFEE